MYEDVSGFYSLDVCFVEAEKYVLHAAKRRGLNSALARSILKNVSGIIQLVDKSLHENHKLSPCTSTRVIVSFLSKPKGSNVATTHRSSARHPRPPHPPHSCVRTSARLGHLRARSTDLQRSSPNSARLFVSRPPPPRTSRLDQSTLGRLRKQSPRQVLRTHAQRPQTTPIRNHRLAQTNRCRSPNPRDRLGSAYAHRSPFPPPRHFPAQEGRSRTRR